MIIENPDAFKSWLTSILEPLCDADPAALAKYVYALVKKDKPLEELREGMLDQLDVFLQQETKPFVDMLFKSLDGQDYLKPGAKRHTPALPDTQAPEKEFESENHVVATNGSSDDARPEVRPPPRHRVVVTRAPKPAPVVVPTPATAPADAPAPAPAPMPAAAPPPLLNRGPHTEQTLVKVLPTELLDEPVDQPPRRRDRRADSLRDKEERRRRRSRSWERRTRARRHQPHAHNDDRRRPLSRSPSPRGRYRNRSPPAPLDRPNSRSRSRSPVPVRDREHERERERMRVTREMERDRMSRDRDHRDRLSRSRDRERSRDRSRDRSRGSGSPRDPRLDHGEAYKRRCRDFDEKGYCMRGDLCQWDHGTDPLVLEDAALTRVLAAPPAVPEYNPQAPDIWCGVGFPPFPPHPQALPHPHTPRELIPIPRVRHEAPGAPPAPPAPRHAPPHKKNFDYNRLGTGRPPLPANAANCSLEVRKVPRGMNDITHLNSHFSKFGKIVNIQVCFEADPEAALLTYSSPAEANVAYKSTEAVLNNRFIKVFWHNPENKQENMPPGQQAIKPAERPNNQHPMSHNKVLINRDNIKATNEHKLQEKAKEMSNGQESAKEPPKPLDRSKVTERMKRAQALIDTQLRQQRLLIDKLESDNLAETQRKALMEAIQSGQEGIETLKKEMVAYNVVLKQMQANARRPKTRQEAEKEILDAELDMFTKQQEGQDVTDLMKRIAELKRQMSQQFAQHSVVRRPHSRGGRFNTMTRFVRGGAQKTFSVNQSVDHRPRALLISGFEADELDALVQHFSQFGEVTNKEVNLAVPELVLQFKLRAHAEQAAINGKNYNDRTLSITWVANTKPGAASEPRPAPLQNGDTKEESKEPEQSTQEPPDVTLLNFDEEEEEDAEEDRSWRR